ncbi:MAG: hypothetical protein HFH08_05380 [Bacilli bacterium]|nr:hypothetical protein [Bacilli bacterium]
MEKKLNVLKKVIFLFLVTFPIFEIMFFYNSITTLVRVILILVAYCWLLFVMKEARKSIKWVIVYLLLLGIYFLCHHFHALNFTSLVPGNFNYNIVKEFLYFLKLSMPVFLIPLFYYLRLNKNEIQKIMLSWIILISGSIVITNFFCISYGSYSDKKIVGNFISWFFLKQNGYNYYDLASKGFFMYANQISTWLLLLVPLCFLWLQKSKSIASIFCTSILLFSMLILGTRVASIGGIIIFVLCFMTYLFFVFLKKEKWDRKLLLFFLGIVIPMMIVLPFSPSVNRMNVLGSISEEPLKEEALATLVMNENGYVSVDKREYIEMHYKEKRIAEQFILKSYPYQHDPDFWYEILNLPVEKRIDYRYLETAMVKRVLEVNDNELDKWFGITNTRIQNIFNIERDFVLQYYAFGIIGCLLFFLPYIVLGYWIIRNWFMNFSLKSSLILSVYLLYFACSYLSGNNMNHLSTIVPFLFLNLALLRKKEENKNLLFDNFKM